MRVEIKSGGDGVACWNGDAIRTWAQGLSEREDELASRNPDLKILAGRITCYGCEVMDYNYGTRCTAQFTKTRYAIEGELEPRAEDANGSLLEIPGLVTRIASDTPEAPTGWDATLPEPEPEPARTRRGWLGRH